MSHLAALWLSLFLLLANAFFVGAEFAVMTARRSRLEPLAAAGSKRAKISLEAIGQVASLLATAQLGITLSSVGLGAVAEEALNEMLAPKLLGLGLSDSLSRPLALAVALLIVAYLHVVVGEMVPKNLAIAGPQQAALLLAPPLLFFSRVLRPVIRMMESLAKAMVRVLGIEPKDELTSAFTVEEVQFMVAESHREGLIEFDRHGLTRRALEFSDRVAGDVAVPLSALVTLPLGATPKTTSSGWSPNTGSPDLPSPTQPAPSRATCTSRMSFMPMTPSTASRCRSSGYGVWPPCSRTTRSRTFWPRCNAPGLTWPASSTPMVS